MLLFYYLSVVRMIDSFFLNLLRLNKLKSRFQFEIGFFVDMC
mgnify:CR=1 FL=1